MDAGRSGRGITNTPEQNTHPNLNGAAEPNAGQSRVQVKLEKGVDENGDGWKDPKIEVKHEVTIISQDFDGDNASGASPGSVETASGNEQVPNSSHDQNGFQNTIQTLSAKLQEQNADLTKLRDDLEVLKKKFDEYVNSTELEKVETKKKITELEERVKRYEETVDKCEQHRANESLSAVKQQGCDSDDYTNDFGSAIGNEEINCVANSHFSAEMLCLPDLKNECFPEESNETDYRDAEYPPSLEQDSSQRSPCNSSLETSGCQNESGYGFQKEPRKVGSKQCAQPDEIGTEARKKARRIQPTQSDPKKLPTVLGQSEGKSQRTEKRGSMQMSLKCFLCNTSFEGGKSLKNHLETVHGPLDSDWKYGWCRTCGESFGSLAEVERHIAKTTH